MNYLTRTATAALVALLTAASLAFAQPQQPISVGAITTQNLASTGVSCTTGSCVNIIGVDRGMLSVQVTGTYTGALSGQVSNDNNAWVTLAASTTFVDNADGTSAATIGSGTTGVWSLALTGPTRFRLVALGAVTGTATITMRSSSFAPAGTSSGGGGGGNVTVTNFPATQAVSLASAPTTAVTGTFWQATQPVSLAVAPTTAVTGTFWQATQPVSGTFWQATQPISASALPLPSGAATETTLAGVLTDTQLRATAVPVSDTRTPALGSATSANSLPVVIASDQGAVATSAPDVYVTGQGSQITSGQNIVLAVAGSSSTDTLGYRSVAIQIVPSAGTVTLGQVAFEGSNDNVNFVPSPLYDAASLTANPAINFSVAATTTRYFGGPLLFRYFRARINVSLTGTNTGIQAFTTLKQAPYFSPQQTVTQATGANLVVSGTLTTVTTVTTLANGQTAHSAASTGSPVRAGGRVNTAVDTTLVAGDASDLFITTGGALVEKPYAVPELDWTSVASASGIANTTTAVTVKAAAAAGVRNYITGIQLSGDTLGAATEFAIRDGAAGTVLWRMKLNTTALVPTTIAFPTPLRGTAATLLEIVTLTAVTGGVYANLQGYTAP